MKNNQSRWQLTMSLHRIQNKIKGTWQRRHENTITISPYHHHICTSTSANSIHWMEQRGRGIKWKLLMQNECQLQSLTSDRVNNFLLYLTSIYRCFSHLLINYCALPRYLWFLRKIFYYFFTGPSTRGLGVSPKNFKLFIEYSGVFRKVKTLRLCLRIYNWHANKPVCLSGAKWECYRMA